MGKGKYDTPEIGVIETRPRTCLGGGVTKTALQVCLSANSVSVHQLSRTERKATRVTSVDAWGDIIGYPDEGDVRFALEQNAGLLRTIVSNSAIFRSAKNGLPVLEMSSDAMWAMAEMRAILNELRSRYRVMNARRYIRDNYPNTILLLETEGNAGGLSIAEVSERILAKSRRQHVVLDEEPINVLRDVLKQREKGRKQKGESR